MRTKSFFPYILCLFFGLAVSSLPIGSSQQSDMICHTENVTDCYPRVFVPTEEFQVVREDQEIPPGLHVRLDITTGLKEAKINDPTESNEALEGLPIDQSMVVVTPDGATDAQEVLAKYDNVGDILKAQDKPAMRDRVPQEPPAYDPVGKIQPPRPDDEGVETEMGSFLSAAHLLDNWKSSVSEEDVSKALEALTDLTHDIYYGVELMKRPEALKTLVGFASDDKLPTQWRHQAASILGHAIQNNPTALKEGKKSWAASASTRCGAKDAACQSQGLIGALHSGLRPESNSGAMKAKMYALSGLIKDQSMRDEFINSDGARDLEYVFLKEGKDWDPVRIRVAQLLMDNFLDESMGAELGVWPRDEAAGKDMCNKSGNKGDGCWEHHLNSKSLLGASFDEEWRTAFLELLQEARDAISASEKERSKEL